MPKKYKYLTLPVTGVVNATLSDAELYERFAILRECF
jgi:hypothetical protein